MESDSSLETGEERYLLRPAGLPRVLQQICTEGVQLAALLNPDGTLLAAAAADAPTSATAAAEDDMSTDKGQGDARRFQALMLGKLVGAVASNSWLTYEQLDSEVRTLYLRFPCGAVSIAPVSQLLLCLLASPQVPCAALRARHRAVQEYLSEPLERLYAQVEEHPA
ncbi:hypothetical protein CDCA_CDCA01G0245 [Cyanidium caldarium]|uniref:Roadblock/LAMTOR2 domain-containing protein n=1 Tax=Cyanidium caldarium TaxID=2771 RepID=A0AAV9IQ41_CYACA|nr:hypothetical protein CDCA_CDCA01G0245 [Cyanidium caldarium]